MWAGYFAALFAFVLGTASILIGTRFWDSERNFVARAFRLRMSSKLERGMRSNYVFVGIVTILIGFVVLALLVYRDVLS